MTDQQPELDQQTRRQEKQSTKASGNGTTLRLNASGDAIAEGLKFLFSRRQETCWSLCSAARGISAAWVTAYVLARLAEIPTHHVSYSLRQRIEESLDWLLEARTPKGGWGFGGSGSPDDADSTAWAVVALRQHGRPAPQDALDLVRSCRRADGGFGPYPEGTTGAALPYSSAPDVTAIAVRALAFIDAASSEFLASHLRTDVQRENCRVASSFFVASTLLDWEPGMAPWFVVNAVQQLTCQQAGESHWEQALLLRCMMRLRMQSAWALAAGLRRQQLSDGSWRGSAELARLSADTGQLGALADKEGILATATALSALAMSDLQPGLYFGSDLPFRRL